MEPLGSPRFGMMIRSDQRALARMVNESSPFPGTRQPEFGMSRGSIQPAPGVVADVVEDIAEIKTYESGVIKALNLSNRLERAIPDRAGTHRELISINRCCNGSSPIVGIARFRLSRRCQTARQSRNFDSLF